MCFRRSTVLRIDILVYFEALKIHLLIVNGTGSPPFGLRCKPQARCRHRGRTVVARFLVLVGATMTTTITGDQIFVLVPFEQGRDSGSMGTSSLTRSQVETALHSLPWRVCWSHPHPHVPSGPTLLPTAGGCAAGKGGPWFPGP